MPNRYLMNERIIRGICLYRNLCAHMTELDDWVRAAHMCAVLQHETSFLSSNFQQILSYLHVLS